MITANRSRNQNVNGILHSFRLRRGLAFGILIITALFAFELFNYSTTEFALADLLGSLKFAGISWATILAVAFCGIDFAGIARLFTPEEGINEPTEVWYLFGAWLLAATMNAMLTWWGVSIAILNHQTLGNAVVAREILLRVVPVFVAVMVWLIRVLIIGTFSVAGDRLFSQADVREGQNLAARRPARLFSGNPAPSPIPARPSAQSNYSSASVRPAPKPTPQQDLGYSRPEPTYHPVSMSARSSNNGNNQHPTPLVRR
jgi:hypothetical protein